MRANTAEGMSPRGLYRNIVEQDVNDEIRNNAIEEYLESEPLPIHLAQQISETGDRYVSDFMWLYHGHPDTGGYRRDYLPSIERNGAAYTKTLVSGVTDSGTFVHVRESEDTRLEPNDPKRYFVATLDLMTPETTEWSVARVGYETRETSYRGTPYIRRELFLSDGLRSIPGGIEDHGSKSDAIRAQKLGSKMAEHAFERMPRIVMGYQGAEFARDGVVEQLQFSAAEVIQGAERITELRHKFGHLAVWQMQQSFSQEVAV